MPLSCFVRCSSMLLRTVASVISSLKLRADIAAMSPPERLLFPLRHEFDYGSALGFRRRLAGVLAAEIEGRLPFEDRQRVARLFGQP
jgi:hypothetical protein